ncbi:FAD binding domain-containing protein [Amycolatopsis acidiphila]|uniref:Molybdopterin dehydrogenase n=1 Tax=Amycolatopsis acidiphila TaxID=715473 RepID=A0A558A2Y0_9PSEU|nr:FAD binding domain-containing protein [Amycolatopsis acidiphila]TVT18620.1 molybdopterin dehydrogenase [Amycolatopsis acidiphila]UIJ56601.1 FAD binding domain-containing protein [Amycolatopsis acidiphila]GHG66446.1 carbon monoxide dehydrogenase [Amycolatopsis acidiphila]
MKAAPFAYVRPSSLPEAVAELGGTGGGGKVIAGGQSLTPVLAMRLARPDTLIDINAVDGLDRFARRDGFLEIGATVRQRRVEHDPASAAVPLLGMALPWVGHRELRSRGTVCGSLAHADPAAELPAVACCLAAEIVATGPGGQRRIPAREFFSGAMTTALEPDEILTAVRLPVARAGEGFGFAEIARRHGDFALAGVVVAVRVGGEAVLTGFGVSDRPVTTDVSGVLDEAVRAACGDRGRLAEELGERLAPVADELVDTEGDAHASGDYRRRLFRVLAGRELAKAYHRAHEEKA